MIHDLKTDPEVFNSVVRHEKKFEIRKDDRPFQVGDMLRLRKTRYTGEEMRQLSSAFPLEYTGDEHLCIVTHILRGPQYGLQDGWVIMSIR